MVAHFDANLARLEVRVKREAAPTEIEDNVIPADRFECDRNRAGAGDVFGDAILNGDNHRIGYSESIRSIAAVVLIVEAVALEGRAIFAQLQPIDRETLSDVRAAANRNHRPP